MKKDLLIILKNIENKIAKPYFSNFIRYATGICNIENPNLEEKKKILIRLLIHCIYNLVGGRANINYIQETNKKFNEFITQLNEEHFEDFNSFQTKLELFIKDKEIKGSNIFRITIKHKFYNQKAFECLQNFKGIGQKNSALFLRFILRYTGVFKIKNKDNLVVPLDRVVWRFYNYYIQKKGNFSESFNQNEFNEFQKFCISYIKKEPILFDNMWLIGHFYGNLFKEKFNFNSLLTRNKNKFLEELEFYIFEYPNKEFKLKNSLQDYM